MEKPKNQTGQTLQEAAKNVSEIAATTAEAGAAVGETLKSFQAAVAGETPQQEFDRLAERKVALWLLIKNKPEQIRDLTPEAKVIVDIDQRLMDLFQNYDIKRKEDN